MSHTNLALIQNGRKISDEIQTYIELFIIVEASLLKPRPENINSEDMKQITEKYLQFLNLK